MGISFKYKVSKEATFEQLQAALKDAIGDENFELSQNAYEKFINLNKTEAAEKEEIRNIIGRYYEELSNKTDKESLKRKDELMDIARFIRYLKEDVKLINMGESPDFIIEVNGEQIGLEHTRFYDHQLVAKISTLEKMCRNVQVKLLEEFPDEKVILNVELDYDKIGIIDNKAFSSILFDYLSRYLFNPTITMPEIFKKISPSPHSSLEVVLSEQYFSKEVDAADLNELIEQKEAKLKKYQANCGLDKIWLLIIVDGDSAKSDHELAPYLLPQREFEFDNVFVFNTFKQICLSTKFGRNISQSVSPPSL